MKLISLSGNRSVRICCSFHARSLGGALIYSSGTEEFVFKSIFSNLADEIEGFSDILSSDLYITFFSCIFLYV